MVPAGLSSSVSSFYPGWTKDPAKGTWLSNKGRCGTCRWVFYQGERYCTHCYGSPIKYQEWKPQGLDNRPKQAAGKGKGSARRAGSRPHTSPQAANHAPDKDDSSLEPTPLSPQAAAALGEQGNAQEHPAEDEPSANADVRADPMHVSVLEKAYRYLCTALGEDSQEAKATHDRWQKAVQEKAEAEARNRPQPTVEKLVHIAKEKWDA